MGIKKYIEKNVYDSAVERINYVFDEFDHFYVAFSGGKDSGVMTNLIFDIAKKRGIEKVPLMYIDFEAQYKNTIEYIDKIFSNPLSAGHWICLPVHLRNAVSQFQPHWICWDRDFKELWVRDYPTNEKVITEDNNPFPFFKKGDEFEDFIVDYGDWISKNNGNKKVACLVSIRSDESLNRFRVIARNDVKRYKNDDSLRWSSQIAEKVTNFYPIYDWRTEDVWSANSKFGYEYNKIYDLMYRAGVSIHEQRICQPYGDDQRKGLNLFHVLENETWSKIVSRVNGANFGNIYCKESILGNIKFKLPPNHTYKSYTKLLLKSLPPFLEQHYREKFFKFLKWWRDKFLEMRERGEEYPHKMVLHDEYSKVIEMKREIPTWRRMCKVLIKNDYWCKSLSFSQVKKEAERQKEIINKWKDL